MPEAFLPMSQQNLSSFIWSVADLLRGVYKQSEYGGVIMPFTVPRRLDCVIRENLLSHIQAFSPAVRDNFECFDFHIDRLAGPFMIYGVPEFIRSDNGLEFVATAIRRWLAQMNVQALYIEPGGPWQNGFAESFHSRLRDDLLNVEEFENVQHARAHAVAWREDYNEYRPECRVIKT
jgi:hypothetical protein